MAQRGAQEAPEPPTDAVSNSIRSISAGEEWVGGPGGVVPGTNLPFCSVVAEEMVGPLTKEARRRSMKALRATAAPRLSATRILPDSHHPVKRVPLG